MLRTLKDQVMALFQEQAATSEGAKANEIRTRLLKEIKVRAEAAKKRNLETTRIQCVQALEHCVT